MKKALSAFAFLVLLLACSPNQPEEGNEKQTSSVATGGVEGITSVSATLNGKATFAKTVSSDMKVGFQFSTSSGILPTNSKTVDAADADAQYNFFATITGLDPDTKYYYRAFIRENGQDTFGVTKEFTTLPTASEISLDQTTLDLVKGESGTLVATVGPDNAYDKSVKWSSDKTSVATVDEDGRVKAVGKGKAVITATAKDGKGVTATCEVLVSNPCPAGAVDLGFRTAEGYRLYWATSNLSASGLCANPEDYGDYYAWGETAPKQSEYSWKNYKWSWGDSNYLTRYCSSNEFWGGSGRPDEKEEFKDYNYADDAARARLGGNWRMPTEAEWKDLQFNCTWALKRNEKGTWYVGMVATSKKEGYTDKSILFPFPGYKFNSVNVSNDTYSGAYWSSTCFSETPVYAWFMVVNHENRAFRNYNGRCAGLSVRPVSE